MNITIAVYYIQNGHVVIKKPFEVERETPKCLFTKTARYLKSELNIPKLKSPTMYPYIEVAMVDADEQTLRDVLSVWFETEAERISCRGIGHTRYCPECGSALETLCTVGADESANNHTERILRCYGCHLTWESEVDGEGNEVKFERYFVG